MKKMILWTVVLFTPLLWTTTAHALFGFADLAALAQRVTIIANQGAQIGHAVTSLSTIQEGLDKLTDQYEHLRQQARGEIGALTSPLTDLAAIPGQLVGDGLDWRADFTNPHANDLIDALDLFSTSGTPLTDHWRDRINAAPDVSEADVLAEYAHLPVSLADRAAANYRRQRDDAEQRTVLNQIVNTAASSAAATVQSARDSYARLRGQTNTSGTALGQAQVAGLITSGEVSAALVQLQAFEATQAAAEELAGEARRREREAARLAALRAARADHARRLTGIAANRDGGESLLFRVH